QQAQLVARSVQGRHPRPALRGELEYLGRWQQDAGGLLGLRILVAHRLAVDRIEEGERDTEFFVQHDSQGAGVIRHGKALLPGPGFLILRHGILLNDQRRNVLSSRNVERNSGRRRSRARSLSAAALSLP